VKLNIKQLTIIALLILGIVGGYRYGYGTVFWQTIVSVGTAAITNLVLTWFKTKKAVFSESAIITGLIIAMVAAPSSPLPLISLLAFVAIISKFLLKINNRSIFNPAALSLLLGVLVFNLPLGWWGDYNHILTIIAGSLLLIEYRGQWKMIYSFLVTLALLTIIQALIINMPVTDELNFRIGIAFFFSFFMLTDPKTRPLMADQALTFGMITAIFSFLSAIFLPSTTFIGGLLVANLATPFLNTLSLKKIRRQANTLKA